MTCFPSLPVSLARTGLAVAALSALSACMPGTGPTTSAAPGATSEGGVPLGPYYLVGIGKDAVPERNATMTLGAGTITGSGPCNTFTATNSAKLPAVKVSQMTWTDVACKNIAFEQRYFQALTQASSAEYYGGVLTLKGPVWLQFEAGTVAGH